MAASSNIKTALPFRWQGLGNVELYWVTISYDSNDFPQMMSRIREWLKDNLNIYDYDCWVNYDSKEYVFSFIDANTAMLFKLTFAGV